MSENLTRTLPCISQGIEALSKDIRSKVGDVASSHQASEVHIRDELNEIKSHLTNLESLQKVCLDQNQVGSEELSKWHSELQQSIQALQACVRTHLDFLSNKETENIASDGKFSSGVVPLRILLGTLRLVSNGVASGIGALVAISSFKTNTHGDSPVTGYVDPHYDDALSPPSLSSRAVLDIWDMAFEAAAKSFAERNVLNMPGSSSGMTNPIYINRATKLSHPEIDPGKGSSLGFLGQKMNTGNPRTKTHRYFIQGTLTLKIRLSQNQSLSRFSPG